MNDESKLKVEMMHFEARERQKKQSFQQIILPVIITAVVLLIVLAVAIVIAIKGPEGAGFKTGQITLIVVLFLALLIGALLIWIFIKAIDGIYKLNQTLPRYGKIALEGTVQAEETLRGVADGAVKPIIAASELGSKVKQVGKSFKDRMTPEG